VLVKGSDYAENEIVGHDVVKSYGGKVKRVPLLRGHSTTNLIEKNKKK
jgi:D-beta-D-heptose 7-phosphate kinase/D-beta-D-heptose 1-phosphate adenosyltransferase